MDVASRYDDEDEGEVVDNMLACWLVLGNSAGLQGVRGRLASGMRFDLLRRNEFPLSGAECLAYISC